MFQLGQKRGISLINHIKSLSLQMGTELRTVASLHGSPKPLKASSSLGLGQNSNKRHRPYSSLSDEDTDDSDLEYDEDELEIEVGTVARNRDFYAQLEEEEKANAQVTSYFSSKFPYKINSLGNKNKEADQRCQCSPRLRTFP